MTWYIKFAMISTSSNDPGWEYGLTHFRRSTIPQKEIHHHHSSHSIRSSRKTNSQIYLDEKF